MRNHGLQYIFIIAMLAGMLATRTNLQADPLTQEQIKAFKIEDLKSENFDARMTAFRVIKEQAMVEKYHVQIIAAIKSQLRSPEISQKRTGIQGQNLMRLEDDTIHDLILENIEENKYKMQPQHIYFQRALTDYILWRLEKAKVNSDCILF